MGRDGSKATSGVIVSTDESKVTCPSKSGAKMPSQSFLTAVASPAPGARSTNSSRTEMSRNKEPVGSNLFDATLFQAAKGTATTNLPSTSDQNDRTGMDLRKVPHSNFKETNEKVWIHLFLLTRNHCALRIFLQLHLQANSAVQSGQLTRLPTTKEVRQRLNCQLYHLVSPEGEPRKSCDELEPFLINTSLLPRPRVERSFGCIRARRTRSARRRSFIVQQPSACQGHLEADRDCEPLEGSKKEKQTLETLSDGGAVGGTDGSSSGITSQNYSAAPRALRKTLRSNPRELY